jgi:sugar phosphate isomerase/epimerase
MSRTLRGRLIGCAVAAATGAVLLVTAAAAQADVGPNQATFRDRVGDGIKTGQMGVQLFNYGGFISTGSGQSSQGAPSPITITRPECLNNAAPATRDSDDCRWYRLELLFAFLRSKGVTNVELFGHAAFPTNDEFDGQFGLNAYRALLDQYGLHAGGWHGSMDESQWDARIAAAKVLGTDYIGSGGFPAPGIEAPAGPGSQAIGYQNTLATVEALNRLGKRSIEAGLGPVYWHNHQTEFTNKYVDDGVLKSAIDIIMERTDPRYVVGEIDVKWSSDALDDVTGTQTAAYINKPAFGARVQMLHIKDGVNIANPFPASAPHVATGSGEIDFKPIFAAANNRVRYYHQEHDGGSLSDADVSLSNLKGINTASVAAMLALPPSFPSVPAGTPAAANVVPVLVQNTGDQPLTFGTAGNVIQIQQSNLDSPSSLDFAVVSDTCRGTTLQPGNPNASPPVARGTCVVNVGFGPRRTDTTSVARLVFNSNADTATENVLLVGKSTTQALSSVGGNVPSIMQLALTPAASFGTFVPGVARDYNTAIGGTVTTTTSNAALTMTDLSTTGPGVLENGTWKLASPLNWRFVAAGQTPLPAFAPLNGTNDPHMLRSWSSPVTNEGMTLDLRQSIGANEVLRAGSYSKSLTFTLSTTTP